MQCSRWTQSYVLILLQYIEIMKKYIIVLTLFSLVASSCKGLLDEQVYGKPTAEEMLSEPENVAKVVGQAYAEITWLHDHWGYWGINTLSSDECVNPVRNPGEDWSDNGYWTGFNNHTWTANDLSFEYVWQFSNAGAVLCNKILSQLEPIKESLKESGLYDRFSAELKVLRCYYYYTLFDSFGRIPYLDNYSSAAVPQSETWEIWNKLVTVLEEEAPKLPVITPEKHAENYGRCSQGMAYTLLARLYLNAASYGVTASNCGLDGVAGESDFYKKCVDACQKVIDSKSYSIEDNFFTNFKILNESSKENIFVIVEDGNSSFNYRDVDGKMSNKLRITNLSLNYCHQICWKTVDKPWNGFCAPEDFLETYEDGDRRGPCPADAGTHGCDGYGWFLGPVYESETSDVILEMTDKQAGLKAIIVPQVTSLTDATHNDGARFLKYEVDKQGANKYCDNDFVLFRYADVLYMQYEAALRSGDNAKCSELLSDPEFQRIRTRVGCAPYSSLDLDELLRERGREFAWELTRRRDLIRYNRFAKGEWDFKKADVDNHRDWFPIPRKMIETSNGLWTQNPGYETDK